MVSMGIVNFFCGNETETDHEVPVGSRLKILQEMALKTRTLTDTCIVYKRMVVPIEFRFTEGTTSKG